MIFFAFPIRITDMDNALLRNVTSARDTQSHLTKFISIAQEYCISKPTEKRNNLFFRSLVSFVSLNVIKIPDFFAMRKCGQYKNRRNGSTRFAFFIIVLNKLSKDNFNVHRGRTSIHAQKHSNRGTLKFK